MKETSRWQPVKDLMVNTPTIDIDVQSLGLNHLDILNAYKFAAKLIGKNKRILDLGCRDGLGTWILAKECGSAVGISNHPENCKAQWKSDNIEFYSSPPPFEYDAIVNLFYEEMDLNNLKKYGLVFSKIVPMCWENNFTHYFNLPLCKDVYVGIKK